MKLGPESKDYLKLLGMQKEITLGVLSVRARIDEAKLRGAPLDKVEALLNRLKAEREMTREPEVIEQETVRH